MKIINCDAMIDLHAEIKYCEYCDKRGVRLECHHIFARGMGSGSRLDIPWNLIILCVEHHKEADAGKLTKRELLGIAAEREIWKIKRS